MGSTARQRVIGGLGAIVLLLGGSGLVGACGSSGGSDATSTTSEAKDDTSSSSTEVDEEASTTVDDDVSTTLSPTTTAPGLPDATEGQHSAPPSGEGTALLTDVRVGKNEGFERIVFEFAGETAPGYIIQWVDGPILSDGAGEPVDVDGEAYLEMVMQPASGVDLSAPELTVTYEGPDRVPTDQTDLITDLVRTGDFEAVLTWVAGATERAPIRVQTLSSPTRIVVDVETS